MWDPLVRAFPTSFQFLDIVHVGFHAELAVWIDLFVRNPCAACPVSSFLTSWLKLLHIPECYS